jgi:ABC-type multidrug transport system ATPase subunit
LANNTPLKIGGLRGFDLYVAPGVIGSFGPNGAGKSTLMRVLAPIVRKAERELPEEISTNPVVANQGEMAQNYM